MRLLDRLLGRNITLDPQVPPTDDGIAVEKYEYLRRTAKPDTIEKAHVDAFEQLTPLQRNLVFERFTADPPAGELPPDATSTTLAKFATRAEAKKRGALRRALSGKPSNGSKPDTTGPLDGSLLGTFATYAIASSAIDAIFWTGLVATTVTANSAGEDKTATKSDGIIGLSGNDYGNIAGFDF